MSQTIRKSFLSISLFFAMGLSTTACGPEEGLDNGEQSGSMAAVKQAATAYENFRTGLTNSVGTKFCLKVKDSVVADSTPAQIYQCNVDGPPQHWYHDPLTLELRSALSPDYCLDLAGGVVGNGYTVQLYHCNGTKAQQWSRSVTNEFRSEVDRNFCLDVGGAAANGSPVQIYLCDGTNAQKWFVL